MQRKRETLTDKMLQEIYTDPEFCRSISHTYPHSYGYRFSLARGKEIIVSEEQQKEAMKEFVRLKEEAFTKHKNDLLFCKMGSDCGGPLENHRIRTTFKNAEGHRWFIELCYRRDDSVIFNHVVDRDLEDKYYEKLSYYHKKRKEHPHLSQGWKYFNKRVQQFQEQPYYHNTGITRRTDFGVKTQEQIVNVINEIFDCHFKSMIVNGSIYPDDKDVFCESPKK